MKCQKCMNEKSVVFRTTPIGSNNAMWNCIDCIKGNNTAIPYPNNDIILLTNDLIEVKKNIRQHQII